MDTPITHRLEVDRLAAALRQVAGAGGRTASGSTRVRYARVSSLNPFTFVYADDGQAGTAALLSGYTPAVDDFVTILAADGYVVALGALNRFPTDWFTSGFTIMAGAATLTDQRWRFRDGRVDIMLKITLANALTVTDSGDFANIAVASLVGPPMPDRFRFGAWFHSGATAGTARITPAGTVELLGGYGVTTIAAGMELYIQLDYPV